MQWDEEKLGHVIDHLNDLSGNEQVYVWRVLGARLLQAGNALGKMIAGQPDLETAVYSLMAEALSRPSPRE